MKNLRPRTLALIGGDGAGKTTLARMLVESDPSRFRYLYMGVNVDSSNVALPTSRIISALKRRRPHKPEAARRSSAALPSARRSRTGNALRLVNRLAEEWFRQAVSWHHQLRGRIVICDRHFLFDFALELERRESLPLWRRLHLWTLHKLYPSPGLAIFLDAPPRTLLARKGEASAEWLAAHRLAVLKLGMKWPNFHCVNADRPLHQVYLDVAQIISRNWPLPAQRPQRTQKVESQARL